MTRDHVIEVSKINLYDEGLPTVWRSVLPFAWNYPGEDHVRTLACVLENYYVGPPDHLRDEVSRAR